MLKHVNFTKSGENLHKVGINHNFPEIKEKCTEAAKIWGKLEICSLRLKKGHQKFWRMKI